MIAVDSNVLVYAHREDSEWHSAPYACVLEQAEGRDPWAIPWPCLHEFLAIVTHPRIYAPPTPLETALDQVQAWLESPALVLLCETEHYWQQLQGLLRPARQRAASPRRPGRRAVPGTRHHRAVDRRPGFLPLPGAEGPQSPDRVAQVRVSGFESRVASPGRVASMFFNLSSRPRASARVEGSAVHAERRIFLQY